MVVTDRQERKLMIEYQTNGKIGISALKARTHPKQVCGIIRSEGPYCNLEALPKSNPAQQFYIMPEIALRQPYKPVCCGPSRVDTAHRPDTVTAATIGNRYPPVLS